MIANQATLSDISSADWSLRLGAIGQVVKGIEDVAQCLAIILSTPKGSDPLRPTFGSDLWRFVDSPVNAALPGIVREARTAIGTWEPRVKVVSISAAPVIGDSQSGAHLQVTVNWQLKFEGASAALRRTTVGVSGGA